MLTQAYGEAGRGRAHDGSLCRHPRGDSGAARGSPPPDRQGQASEGCRGRGRLRPGLGARRAAGDHLQRHGGAGDRGRDAIMAFYRRNWAAGAHGTGAERETHVGENPFVVALGDYRLLATHTAIFAARRGVMPRLIGFGEFRDEIVFEDGAWRIADRRSSLRRRPRRSA
ncbi:nuclear transport factor 2 family protein [Rhizorhabdus histidinilytica]